jgi:hypothetical protein
VVRLNRALVCLAALLLVLTACSGGGSHGRSSSPSPTHTETVHQSSTRFYDVANAVPLRDGDVRHTHTLSVARSDVRSQGVLAVSPTGDIVLDVYRAYDVNGPLEIHQSHLHLLRQPGYDDVLIDPDRDANQAMQVYQAVARGGFVAWQETPSTSLYVQPWRLYAYTGQARGSELVARSPVVGKHPPPPVPGETGPSIARGRVYWSQVDSCASTGSCKVAIYSRTLRAGNDARLEVRNAMSPITTPNGLVFARTGLTSTHLGKKEFSIAIKRWDGTVQRLTEGRLTRPGDVEIAANRAAIAWSVSGRRDTLTVLRSRGADRTIIRGLPHQCFTTPTLASGLLIWGDGACGGRGHVGGYLLDLAHHKLFSVGNSMGLYGVDAAGRWVTWQAHRKHAEYPHGVVFKVAELPR